MPFPTAKTPFDQDPNNPKASPDRILKPDDPNQFVANKASKPILCLDFDGVCHSYTSPWVNAWTIPDPPVPGLFEFLERAMAQFQIAIYSSRSVYSNGREAMAMWFINEAAAHYRDYADAHALCKHLTDNLMFPDHKPAAFVTLDDRAVTFKGEWPDVAMLRGFIPWNQHMKKRGNVEKAANPVTIKDYTGEGPCKHEGWTKGRCPICFELLDPKPGVPDTNVTLE